MTVSTPTQQVSNWLAAFGAALERGDHAAATAMFDDDCYWRDLVSFTWNLKTMEGKEAIRAMLDACAATTKPDAWAIEGDASEAGGVTEAWFGFETAVARGRGQIRLKGDKCWTLLTTMTELKGFEEAKGATRPKGVEHGASQDRKSWLERKTQEEADLGYKTQPYCVIVGGGQGGIALGARLKRLGVPTIIMEKNPRAGDSWRNRYRSLCLHDPVWYDHLPYLPFPGALAGVLAEGQDRRLARDVHQGDGAELLDARASATSATYDEAKQEWTVSVDRNGETVVLRPKQLVLATGMSGMPNVPQIPGAESFKGDIHHSSKHPGGETYRGKKCVVIGSNNSAHDICADLWEHGADVTMLQRSIDAHRALRHADGTGARRAVLRGSGEVRHDHQHRRHDLRVDPVQDHAHLPDPRVPGDGQARCRLLCAAGEGRLHARLRATTARGCS